MYPSGELGRLAQRKRILQARIAVRRLECAAAAIELARPIAYVDRGIELWHRVAPFFKFLAVPGGLFLTRLLTGRRRAVRQGRRKGGRIAAILSVLPLILRGLKMAIAARAVFAARTRPARGAASGRPPGSGD